MEEKRSLPPSGKQQVSNTASFIHSFIRSVLLLAISSSTILTVLFDAHIGDSDPVVILMNASLCFGNAKKFLSEIRRLEQIDIADKLEIKKKGKDKVKDLDKNGNNSESGNMSGQFGEAYEAVSGMRLANIHAYQSTTAMLKVCTYTNIRT